MQRKYQVLKKLTFVILTDFSDLKLENRICSHNCTQNNDLKDAHT